MLVFVVGCSSSDVDSSAGSVTTGRGAATDDAKLDGSTSGVRLNLESPVALDRAEIRVVAVGDGRPNAVQITNHDISNPDRAYPAILLQGTTSVSQTPELAGQTIACELFFQQSPESQILTTRPGQLVQVVFASVDQQVGSISATLGPVDLISADEQAVPLEGGQITAVIRDGWR
jgi:hypothetical protein